MTEQAENPRTLLKRYADALEAYVKGETDEETIDIALHYLHQDLALAEDDLRDEGIPVAQLIHELLGGDAPPTS